MPFEAFASSSMSRRSTLGLSSFVSTCQLILWMAAVQKRQDYKARHQQRSERTLCSHSAMVLSPSRKALSRHQRKVVADLLGWYKLVQLYGYLQRGWWDLGLQRGWSCLCHSWLAVGGVFKLVPHSA